MSVSNNFLKFSNNLKMSNETVSKIQRRYKAITKRINLDYRNLDSETSYSLYVGSYGRDTEIWTSDIDIIVQLPTDIYHKYNNYLGNGQSSLLQDVKRALQKTYSSSYIKGDGQVIGINFKDNINFEIVPAFLNQDSKSYTYPDSNDGGSWRTTHPRDEIGAISNRNLETNYNLKRLARMVRAWKSKCNVTINGDLIDTMAYKFINNYRHKEQSYLYYDFMSRDFFEYLKNQDRNINYWLAPGSNRRVYKTGNFQYHASSAHRMIVEAIDYQNRKLWYSANNKWRDVYGSKFPIYSEV